MNARTLPTLTCLGKPLDLSPSAFGQLRRSDEIAHDGSALRQRMREEGYLYLPGLLDPAEVLGVRRQVTDRLAELGLLHERQPRLDASYRPGGGALKSSHDLARNNPCNCSGVGQTSGLPVHGVSDSVSIGSPEHRAGGPANRQTGGLPHVPT